MLFKKKKKIRVCVIGLDGAPHSLLLELCRTGVMPSLAKLLEKGRLHKMKASLPEISSVSWSDFMTGANSGTHGIFGFTDLKTGTYKTIYPSYWDIKTNTFWDQLSAKGKNCIIINQPSTFPAKKIKGVMISGFTAFDLDRAVFPPGELPYLKSMGYKIDVDSLNISKNPESIWPELDNILPLREQVLEHYWESEWDLFEFVITDTDRLHHFMWNAYEDSENARHGHFLNYYRKIDQLIGKVAASYQKLTGSHDGFYLLSDHGFCQIEQEVYLNAWLRKEGYLSFSNADPQDISEISEKTIAFALEPNRVYVHLKNKYPRGRVDPSELKSVREEIKRKMEKIEFEGKKAIRRVFYSEEIYSGPLISHGPDMIVLSEYGFDIKGSVKKKDLFGRTLFQGMHTWDDAFFWTSGDAGDDLKISDLARIILGNFT